MQSNQKTEVRDSTIEAIKQKGEDPSYEEMEEMRTKLGDNFIKNLSGIKDYFFKNNLFRILYLIMDMLLENLKKPKFFRMDFECYLESKEREDLRSHKKSSCCCTCGKGIKGNLKFLIVMAVFNIIFGIASKATSFLNKVDDIIANNGKSKGEYTNFGIKLLKKYKLIV